MKKIAIALMLAASVPTVSQAAFVRDDNRPSEYQMVCYPPINPRERDPDVKIDVVVTIDQSRVPLTYSVIHTLRSGRTFDRSTQYLPGRVGYNLNSGAMWWNGLYDHDRSVLMTGALWLDRGIWKYGEKQEKNGRPHGTPVISSCNTTPAPDEGHAGPMPPQPDDNGLIYK
jgi:hypothetical protein